METDKSLAVTPTRTTLFDLTPDWLALDELIEDHGGAVDDPDVQTAIAAWFAELDLTQSQKMAGYVNYIRQKEMEHDAARQYAAYFTAKARSRENRVKFLKDRMKEHMTATGRTKVVTTNGDTISVQKNGGKAPVEIDIVDVDSIPEHFVKTVRTVNNDAVRSALDGGECLDFARVLPVGTHLRIR